MAVAYSVPASQAYLATSPLTRSTPIPFGNKRIPSGGRTSGPLPIGLSSSQRLPGAGAVALDTFIDGRADEYFQRYSLSASARRRSVASSPSDSQARTASQSDAKAPAVTVGFSVPATPFGDGGFSFSSRPVPAVAPRPKGQGLLSRALSGEVKELDVPALSSLSSSPVDPSMFFPGIPLDLLRKAHALYPVFQSELVVTAYSLAARAHQHQARKNGESLLSHCVEVGIVLAKLGLEAETVAAGLLHECLGSSDLFRSQMEEFMPASVVSVLDRVNTISEMSRLYRQHNSSGAFSEETFRRQLVAMEDVNAVLVKLADRIHNMRTIHVLPLERQQALARETLEVYAVVANRLGVWCLKAELEDLAFSILHPEEYAWLKQAVAPRQDPAAFEATINTIKAGLQAHGVAYEDISGRPKSLYGIYSKLLADGKPLDAASLSSIYDLMALRVVVSSKHECYQALRAVQSAYRTMRERSKDFIKDIKKPNGYQSLHETLIGEGGVPVEVQIRTHKMHYIAEYGFAAHWKYKEKLDSEDEWLEKETQYKRWLTQYKLGLHDHKVRPQGSPPTDGSLKALGVAHLDAPEEKGRHLVDPFLRHERFRLQAPVKKDVSVLLATCERVETKEFPLGTTVQQVWRDLGLGQQPGWAMTLNRQLPAGEAVLQSGDLVQVVPLKDVLASGSAFGSPYGSPVDGARRLSLASLDTTDEDAWAGDGQVSVVPKRYSGGSGAWDDLEVYGRNGISSWIGGLQSTAGAASAATSGFAP